jgi:hypothetical protein
MTGFNYVIKLRQKDNWMLFLLTAILLILTFGIIHVLQFYDMQADRGLIGVFSIPVVILLPFVTLKFLIDLFRSMVVRIEYSIDEKYLNRRFIYRTGFLTGLVGLMVRVSDAVSFYEGYFTKMNLDRIYNMKYMKTTDEGYPGFELLYRFGFLLNLPLSRIVYLPKKNPEKIFDFVKKRAKKK